MHPLPKKVEDWTVDDCNTVLRELNGYFRKYNIADFYVIGSRCNGIDNPEDIDISLDVMDDIITWRNLDMQGNRAELIKRAISEQRLQRSFNEKFNVIIEKEVSQKLYKTIEKFDMPYFDLKTRTLYNRNVGDKFPYKIITYDYNNHIFYMKLRPEGLTPEEIVFYTNKIYEKLSPVIFMTVSATDTDKAFMLSSPYNIIKYLTNRAIGNTDLDSTTKDWIKSNSGILKTVDYATINKTIQKALSITNSDLFIKLFHDCEIYENLSVF